MDIKKYIKENHEFINIKDGEFEVILCDLGASIYAIKYCNKYMTQTTVYEKDFTSGGYAGKTVGRVGNRIKGNTITIEGKKYVLLNNEGENVLHGGKEGLSTKTFTSDIKEEDSSVTVSYKYLSKDGESGFPGNMSVEVRYIVAKGENSLKVEYYVSTDKTTACSLTNHAYYCVGEPSLENTTMWIDASRYLYCNPVDLIPIEIREVPEYLDFRKEKAVFKDIDNPIIVNSKAHGYDHNYYFDNDDPNKIKAILAGKSFKMAVYTNFPCMQIYSSNFVNKTPHFDLDVVNHKSMAIEPQDDFSKLNLLHKNEKYFRFMKFVFSKK